MTVVSPAALELAQQLLRHEADGRLGAEALAAAAERVGGRMRGRLTDLVGLAGYHALFARALRLAQEEIPALKRITLDTNAEGGLRGIREFAGAQVDDSAAAAGLTAILANLIGLLVVFVGEDLAIRLVRDAWPEGIRDMVSAEE